MRVGTINALRKRPLSYNVTRETVAARFITDNVVVVRITSDVGYIIFSLWENGRRAPVLYIF